MTKLANFIVKHRMAIGIFFFIVTGICIYLDTKVQLNYDFSKYIPDSAPSIEAYHKVEDEFGMNGTGRIMFKDVTLAEAAIWNEKIESIDGVNTVMWLDDYEDVYKPTSFMDQETLNEYYKDGCTVMDIMFDEDDYSESTYNACHEINEILPDDGSVKIMGSAFGTTATRDNVISESTIILCFAVPIIIIILLLTTDSFFSPVLFIAVIGVSVLINRGTNVIFDSISYITYSISACLQLAISMDYSVFMLHQFEHERSKGLDVEESMRRTLKEGVGAIFASALTTFVGFFAMSFMNFKLGMDLGFVFAKGIVISLLCVIFFMPYLIITFHKLIEKSKHKSLMPSFEPFARWVCKYNWIFIALAILVTVPMYIAQKDNYFTFGTSSVGSGPGTKIYEDEQEIKKIFGDSQTYLVLVPNTGYVDQKALSDELESLEMPTLDGKSAKVIRYAKTLANVLPVGVPDFFAPSDIVDKFKNENYTRILISARTDAESDFAFEVSNKIDETCKKYYGDEYYLTGTVPVTIDMKNVIESDYDIVNLLSILLVMLVLLISFKSLLLPVLLIAVIEGAIFINMGVPYLNQDSLVFVGYLLTSTIQLGATIDYGILLTDKYLAYKEKHNKKEAAVKALGASIPSLLTSGGILIVCGYAIKFVSSITAVKDMGQCIGRGALFSLILVTLVLPQVLCLFDTWITKTTLKNEYKLRIGSKVIKLGRKTEDVKLRAESLKKRNEKIIGKVNERISIRKEQLTEANKNINTKRIIRLNNIIDKLGQLRDKLEKENEEAEEVRKNEK